ncbi:hypothetical protein F4814DRAFT_449120 [Daldinia grandis]|nr:hypothetical protein F4814DRAFT_449120 [Daldinia grandis]
MDLPLLQTTNRAPEPPESRLKSLPRDIRHRIYWHYLDLGWPRVLIVPRPENFNPGQSVYYRRGAHARQTFFFQCTCAILYHISKNSLIRNSLTRIKFLWTGYIADRTFVALRCLPLTHLTVVVGTFTTAFLTRQERIFRRHFKRETAHVTQTLGIFELLELRGIRSVHVECYGSQVALMSEDDRKHLEDLLREYVARKQVA